MASKLRIVLAALVFRRYAFMNRKTSLLVGLLLGVTPFLAGQEPQNQPAAQNVDDVLVSQDLIAWTRMQKPQPAPQPMPPQEKGVPEPGQQAAPPADSPSQDQAPTESFTGKIVKDAGTYILKVGKNTYQLDEQSNVKQYENQDVRVLGHLDSSSNTIRIVKIESLS
jgi:hypothetical protein